MTHSSKFHFLYFYFIILPFLLRKSNENEKTKNKSLGRKFPGSCTREGAVHNFPNSPPFNPPFIFFTQLVLKTNFQFQNPKSHSNFHFPQYEASQILQPQPSLLFQVPPLQTLPISTSFFRLRLLLLLLHLLRRNPHQRLAVPRLGRFLRPHSLS